MTWSKGTRGASPVKQTCLALLGSSESEPGDRVFGCAAIPSTSSTPWPDRRAGGGRQHRARPVSASPSVDAKRKPWLAMGWAGAGLGSRWAGGRAHAFAQQLHHPDEVLAACEREEGGVIVQVQAGDAEPGPRVTEIERETLT